MSTVERYSLTPRGSSYTNSISELRRGRVVGSSTSSGSSSVGAPTEEEPEEVDDPTTRPLRSSEMELVYDDPRGVRLYRSTVDTRWVLYQVDPRSGMPMQQELQAEEAEHVKRQLYGSPYWLIPMEQPHVAVPLE